ncbi:MAG: hypothetical protein JO361_00385 [Gammaproteobacteria bacterium]|nr:hypothetical protein [Gammaproteobacteria bacterium]
MAPGGGRILACLKQHKEEVSPGCKEAVVKALQGSAAAPSPPASPPASPLPNPPDRSSASPATGAVPAASSSAAPPASTNSSAKAQPAARAGSGPARYYELKRVTAMMKLDPAPSSPPVNANHEARIFSLLAPTDWSLVGGFTNKADAGSCFSDMIQVRGAVKNSDGTYGMGVAPQSTFRYADDPAVRQQWEQRDRFDEKYKLKGCPIVAPMHAADFIREYLVWKFNKDRPQVTSEPFPELEQLVRLQLGLGPTGGGAGAGATRVEAARVRASATADKGEPIDEWWSAAIVVHPVPVAGRGVAYDWHAEQITVFQTPKGKLDGYDKLYRVMATSVRIDPQFQAWNSGFVNQIYTQWAREVQKQNAMVAAFQQHVIETIQGVTANQQRGSMVAAYGADQLVRGVQTFRDPSTGRTVELSNLYDHAWANGNDKYIVTDDPNFNPNGRVNGDWGELQLVRPQP